MPEMMAWKMAAMALTIAVRQPPMAEKIERIC